MADDKKTGDKKAVDKKGADKEPGRIAQIRQSYQAIRGLDPKIGWWMLGAALLTFVVIAAIGFALGGFWRWYFILVAIPSAALAAVFVMNRRGNKAMYTALDGQPGASGAALMGMGKRGWYTSQEPVAVDAVRGTKISDMTGAAMVFRALGRPGIVLIGEGPAARVTKLLKAEEKKAARVAPGVPIHLWTLGEGEGEVPIRKLSSKLTRMRPVLTKQEVSVVNKRLRSLPGIRSAVPAGVDPTRARMNRGALRGK
ncbi:MAG TPA: DUF4191 domain-containing protein [Phycicoccus sp.]|nr:DUF4191 domain-containing protein [Phycicoccus sp.]HQK31366.1 DUF4191 domain-containing protein [Phycicoccus sp.]HQY95369.1 DUF4191 domain-containing protein [Phycicoccus sp.]HRA43471.1 DUF4191 domain-containing protein [Phycicoccus sp.]